MATIIAALPLQSTRECSWFVKLFILSSANFVYSLRIHGYQVQKPFAMALIACWKVL
jgi:hypothetical protein